VTKFLAWFIRPKPAKPVPPSARLAAPPPSVPPMTSMPPAAAGKPVLAMNVDLSGPEFDQAVEKALERIIKQNGADWLMRLR
jgi:hypothetical protein